MGQSVAICTTCGAAACVRVLEGYTAGVPVFRHYCLTCADRHYDVAATRDQVAAVHRVSVGSLLMVAGLTVAGLGIVGDYLGIHGSPGFGWYKQLGLLTGGLLVCLSAFWRVDVLGVVGTVVFTLSASANMLGLGGTEGFGWKHRAAVAIGLLLILIGYTIRRRRRQAHAVPPGPKLA